MSRTIEIQAIDPCVNIAPFSLNLDTQAALAGGYVAVINSPSPPLIDIASLECHLKNAGQKVNCFYKTSMSAVPNGIGQNVREIVKASQSICGLKINFNDACTDTDSQNLLGTAELFKRWGGSGSIAVDASDLHLPSALWLAHQYMKPIHINNVVHASEIKMIKHAKEMGVLVTCGVNPINLFCTTWDMEDFGQHWNSSLTLGSPKDVETLWIEMNSIDCITSNHTSGGLVGLETTLGLMLHSVAEKRISLECLIDKVSTNPRKIFRVPEFRETCAVIDLEETYYFDSYNTQPPNGWTPFEGHKLTGRVREVFIKGREVYKDGEFQDYPDKSSLIY